MHFQWQAVSVGEGYQLVIEPPHIEKMYDWKNGKKIHRFPPVLRLENSRPPGLMLKLPQRLPPPQGTHRLPRRKKNTWDPQKTSRLLFSRSGGGGGGQKPLSNTWKNMCRLVVVGTWNAPIFYQNSYHAFFCLNGNTDTCNTSIFTLLAPAGNTGVLVTCLCFFCRKSLKILLVVQTSRKKQPLGMGWKKNRRKKNGNFFHPERPKRWILLDKLRGKTSWLVGWLVSHPIWNTYFLSNWFNIFSSIFGGWTFQKIVEKPPPDVDRIWCDRSTYRIPRLTPSETKVE